LRYFRAEREQMISGPAPQIEDSVAPPRARKPMNERKLSPQQPFAAVEFKDIAGCVAVEEGGNVFGT
jgi:hypothetical protein